MHWFHTKLSPSHFATKLRLCLRVRANTYPVMCYEYDTGFLHTCVILQTLRYGPYV